MAHDYDRQNLLSLSMSSPSLSSDQASPLKPLILKSHQSSVGHHHGPNYADLENLNDASFEDAALKARIRRLRLISRVLSFLISLAVLIPITMTLVKFLSTKNTFRAVIQDGQEILRTAWAKDTRASPTYVYFSIAAISVILNFLTIFAYQFGIEKANVASYAASWFSLVVMIGNLVVWSVAAAMYRDEKDKNGKSNDLWGWTCSAGARALQKEFARELKFDQYCNVQSVSWYIGLVQVGAALLTIAIYVMVLMRRKSKKNLEQHLKLNGFEPSRR